MENTRQFAVERMCSVFTVSRSGYYKWLSSREITIQKNSDIAQRIQYEYERSRCTYGSPRIADALNQKGYSCSKSTIARQMRSLGISVGRKRKFKVTTDSKHKYRVFPNLLNREFDVRIPGTVWVSDITYIRVNKHWLYLTTVIDLADRMVIGWSLSSDMSALNTVMSAFNNALTLRVPEEDFIFHSDRGVQYACDDFTNLLRQYKVRQSMSRKGNCWDNAVAESFFKTIKIECIYRQEIDSNTMAYRLVFDYIQGWYNTMRIHSSLGGLSPLQAFIKKSNYLKAA